MENGKWRKENKKREMTIRCNRWVFNVEKWVAENPRPQGQKIQMVRNLDVFNLSYTLAMEVFQITTKLPKEERYALTDQIHRSSRGVCGAIVEGFAKRKHENVFKNQLNDALGSSEETKLWLDFALDCNYLSAEKHRELTIGYDQVGAMLWSLMNTWRNFL